MLVYFYFLEEQWGEMEPQNKNCLTGT